MKGQIIQGDCLEALKNLPAESVDCCITSPPYYGLRDYGVDGQIGLEKTAEEYVNRLVAVFHEVKRVLKEDGTLWLNIGDSYWGSGSRGYDFTDKWTEASEIQAGSKGTEDLHNLPKLIGNKDGYKNKDLIGIPWMLAFALRADGWYLRQDIIWAKPNPMPESVKDRCTKSHEYLFLLSKSQKYYFDYEAIQEEATGYDGRKDTLLKGSQKYATAEITADGGVHGYAAAGHERWQFKTSIRFGGNKYGDNEDSKYAIYSGNEWTPQTQKNESGELIPVRNKRDVWMIPVQPTKEAHFATYPEALVEPCILAGSRPGGVVLDPFFGSGTTGRVAIRHERDYIGIELNPEYIEIAKKRTSNVQAKLF